MFIISLLLFLALVALWVVLPGAAMEAPVQESVEPLAVNPVGQTA